MSKTSASQPPSPPPRRPFDLWELLGGAKFATVLLLFWALVASVGTFLPQGQEPAAYEKMLGPFWAPLAIGLGLTRMYYSPWFLALLGLLCVNLSLSVMQRISRLRREDAAVKVECPASGLAKIATRVKLPEAGEAAQEKVEGALRSLGLGFRKAAGEDQVSYYAERGRWRRWGSTWAHVGFLVIFLGALLGHWPGLGYNGYLPVMEGATEAVPQGEGGKPTGLTVKVHRFQVVGDAEGRPRDYACDLELFDGGRSIERRTIRVNTPLEYGTLTFYQAGYGMSGFRLALTDATGKRSVHPVPTGPQGELEPMAALVMPNPKGPAWFVRQFLPHAQEHGDHYEPISGLPVAPAAEVFENPDPMKNPDDWRPLGWVAPGRSVKTTDGSKLEFSSLALFTGLQYRKDAGYPVVAAGFCLSMLGLMLSFYVGHRRVRVALVGSTCYVAGVPGTPGNDPGSLPDKLVERLQQAAPSLPTSARTRRSEHAPA